MSIEMKEDIVLLQKLNSFYWDKVRETLSTTHESTVRILNLGDFERLHYRIDRYILKLENTLKKTKNPEIIKRCTEDLALLYKMKEYEQFEKDRKEDKKIEKDEYKLNKDLEGEGEDS